jgi:glycosyltransferase involved in cell wall biosynthesis
VQRPLKFATHLPALGIETHVLAPARRDDAVEGEPELPTQAWIHRVRYVGPSSRKPLELLAGKEGIDRLRTQVALQGRRLLVPDENVPWSVAALPAALRIARQEKIDVVLTTSPPGSLHFVGAAVQKTTGAKWVADLRDSLADMLHRRHDESALVRLKEKGSAGVARLVASRADAIITAADFISDEARSYGARGEVRTIANGCDFDDFAGLEHRTSDVFRIVHTGFMFPGRDLRPFLRAFAAAKLDDAVVRFAGDFRDADRALAEELGISGRVESLGPVSRRRSLELQRDAEVLLLEVPAAGGRGVGVPSGKLFEYLAAERPILAAVPPDGVAAQLVRDTGAGLVAAPDDVEGLRVAIVELHARWRACALDGPPLSPEWRAKLSRAARVEELAELLRSLA